MIPAIRITTTGHNGQTYTLDIMTRSDLVIYEQAEQAARDWFRAASADPARRLYLYYLPHGMRLDMGCGPAPPALPGRGVSPVSAAENARRRRREGGEPEAEYCRECLDYGEPGPY